MSDTGVPQVLAVLADPTKWGSHQPQWPADWFHPLCNTQHSNTTLISMLAVNSQLVITSRNNKCTCTVINMTFILISPWFVCLSTLPEGMADFYVIMKRQCGVFFLSLSTHPFSVDRTAIRSFIGPAACQLQLLANRKVKGGTTSHWFTESWTLNSLSFEMTPIFLTR